MSGEFIEKNDAAAIALGWSRKLPDRQAIWWHWTGDIDTTPVPLSVLKSIGAEDTFFVSMGQWGWDRPEDVQDIGGWWMPCPEPETPDCMCP